MIEELAGRVFASRDAAHRAHWATGSYAAHMALGDFYDGVIDAVDAVVETYQGRFGLIGPFSAASDPEPNVILVLERECAWIEANADAIANGSSAVRNLIDGLIEVYRVALYKLNNLN